MRKFLSRATLRTSYDVIQSLLNIANFDIASEASTFRKAVPRIQGVVEIFEKNAAVYITVIYATELHPLIALI